LPHLSIRNEKKVLNRIKEEAVAAYKKYPTTYEEDLELLKNPNLSFNESNCLLYRSGEKKIL